MGLYPDGQPGEIFLKMAKEGSTVSAMDSFATTVSVALQYRVPLRDLVKQVRPRPVRAERLHRQPGDPDREVDSSSAVAFAVSSGRQGGARSPGSAVVVPRVSPSALRRPRPSGAATPGASGFSSQVPLRPIRLRPAARQRHRSDAPTAAALKEDASSGMPAERPWPRARQASARLPPRTSSRSSRPTAQQPAPKASTGTARHRDALARQGERRLQDPGGTPRAAPSAARSWSATAPAYKPAELRLDERLQLNDSRARIGSPGV